MDAHQAADIFISKIDRHLLRLAAVAGAAVIVLLSLAFR